MLGNIVVDKITNYNGKALEVSQWLNGCVRVGIQSQKLDKDGNIPDIVWVDARQVENFDLNTLPEFEYLGKMVQDNITGYLGVVVAETFTVYNDHQVGIQCQKLNSDGGMLSVIWLYTNRIKIIESKIEPIIKGPSGPQDDPIHSAYKK